MSHRYQFQKSTMLIEFIVVDSPPLLWTLVTLVRHLVLHSHLELRNNESCILRSLTIVLLHSDVHKYTH